MKGTLLLMMILLNFTVQAQDTNCPTVENEEQIFCSTTAATISNLKGEAGTDGLAWYATPQGGDALAPTQTLVDDQIYYAGNESGSCLSRVRVVVQIDPQPIAGRTSSAYFCANDEPVDLFTYMAPLTDGRMAQPGGTFTPSLASGTTMFDPSIDAARQYTYTVTSPYRVCDLDDAKINVFIAPAPTAGEDGMVTLGSEDDPVDLFSYLGGTSDVGGQWSPQLTSGSGIFDPEFDQAGTYTYTVEKTTQIGNLTFGLRTITCRDIAVVKVVVQEDSQTICHKGETLVTSSNAVPAHLGHGDTVGSCSEADHFSVDVVVSPNPSPGIFKFSSKNVTLSSIGIKNMQGEVLKNFVIQNHPHSYDVNLTDLRPGIYFAEIQTSKGIAVNRIIKN